jgi:hypothetical protein
MQDLTAKRTLVKSPPELWNELSEVERLARHLDAFGEIKITKLEPEHTVAWEGEGASGTVSIEPSGWGTKVTVTAQVEQAEAAARAEQSGAEAPEMEAAKEQPEADVPGDEPEAPRSDAEAPPTEPELSPEPEHPREPDTPRRRGLFARLFGRRTPSPAVAEQPEQPGPAADVAAPEGPSPEEARVSEEASPDPVAEDAAPDPVADEPAPEPDRADRDLQAILDDVLDALGSAHHRPFSRG